MHLIRLLCKPCLHPSCLSAIRLSQLEWDWCHPQPRINTGATYFLITTPSSASGHAFILNCSDIHVKCEPLIYWPGIYLSRLLLFFQIFLCRPHCSGGAGVAERPGAATCPLVYHRTQIGGHPAGQGRTDHPSNSRTFTASSSPCRTGHPAAVKSVRGSTAARLPSYTF